jgi:hypothetical protein
MSRGDACLHASKVRLTIGAVGFTGRHFNSFAAEV